MKKTRSAYFEIFDPRQRHVAEWKGHWPEAYYPDGLLVVAWHPLHTGEAHDLPSRYYHALESIKKAILENSAGNGFVGVDPHSRDLRNLNLPVDFRRDGSTLGYFPGPAENLRAQESLRANHVSFREWTIGICRGHFDVFPKSESWFRQVRTFDLEFFVKQSELILFMSTFIGETWEGVMYVRPDDAIDAILEELAHAQEKPNLG